ncbi:helix-turn-helix domain-containing protein [Brevundimonas diminuta]|uniref:helix-turn-helix domain-containing protein n=1 Tax=Brevundimonas diminuta TaxID=293 RepID=UPI002097C3F8|nr:XRE family transcriptional regulator [Brevundimonas diminuta]MCO8030107.1 helix-turn-helix domain-containing protein [Brevundimonas diminuta]
MLSLAPQSEAWKVRLMAGPKELLEDDRVRAGAALKILRKRAGLSGEAAAHEAGVHAQTWRNYENGRRFMDAQTLARMVAALGATVEEHALEVERLPGSDPAERSFAVGLEERGRVLKLPVGGYAFGGAARPAMYDLVEEPEVVDFADYFAHGTRVLRLGGMSMVPYAEPGGFVTYNPLRPARRGQGAVIQMKDGSYHVKRFERITGNKLILTELYPEERELEFDLEAVEGVYAIGLRGD